jgi:hypothetical protein
MWTGMGQSLPLRGMWFLYIITSVTFDLYADHWSATDQLEARPWYLRVSAVVWEIGKVSEGECRRIKLP